MYLGFDPIASFYWSIIILIFGLIFSLKICEYFKISYKLSILLYIWHFIFSLIYFKFITSVGGDAINYYRWGITGERDFSLGTGFVANFTGILINYFNFSFIDCFILHNLFGYLGLLAFAGAIKQATEKKTYKVKALGFIFIFLPSVSFWSSYLGKDALAFMACTFLLWSALDLKKRKVLLFFSIFIMLMVRPHIAVAMATAAILAFIFDKRTNFYSRLFMGSISLITLVSILPLMLNRLGLEDANDINDINDYVNQRQSYNLDGGSSVDISNMSLPMQMITYLFRPLPFEAHNIFAFLASLDNVILVYLFALAIFYKLKLSAPSIDSNRVFLWAYSLIALIMLSSTTANLGIAMRQKWMFLPCIIFLLLSFIGTRNFNKLVLKNEK